MIIPKDINAPAIKNLFIRVPKTASQSIDRFKNITAFGHKPYSQLDEKLKQDAFVFACVRNPYERFVSGYYFLGHHDSNRMRIPQYTCPTECLEMIQSRSQETNQSIYYNIVYRPQHTFVTDENGALAVDYLMYYENLLEDWNAVSTKLFNRYIQLPYINKTKKKRPVEETLSSYDKKLIQEIYEKDFEMFNY